MTEHVNPQNPDDRADAIIHHILNQNQPALDDIRGLIRNDEWCQELAQSLVDLKSLSLESGTAGSQTRLSEIEISQIIEDYYCQEITSEQADSLLSQLRTFPESCRVFSRIFEESFGPVDQTIEETMADFRTLSLAAQVIETFADKPKVHVRPIPVHVTLVEEILHALHSLLSLPRLSFALTILFIVFGGYWARDYYRTGYRLIMASNLLEENLRTYKDNPQLSGAYAPESLFLMDAPVAGSRSGDELALKVALQAMADGVASISHIRLVVENRMAQKEFDEAERYIKQGYLLSEKRPQEINRLDIDKLQKDYALTKAEHLAKTALENGDDSFDNYRIRAEIAILKEEPASALDLLETVPARFRSLPGYLNLLGVTRFHQEHYEAALQLFQQALQVDSTFGKAYYNLALVYSELGEKEKARENFEKYKSLEKDERWMRIADSQIR